MERDISLPASAAAAAVAALLLTSPVFAHDNNATVSVQGDQRCVTSNGLPDHETGTFPNAGNPHTISAQSVHLCVPVNPARNSQPAAIHGSIGVAINGVQIRPGTADWYDPSSPRGFSRDSSSGWNLEGLGARDLLGMDQNNAHVDERGLYHYHGVAEALAAEAHGTLIGYAADGFEIHYVGSAATSSYQLKSGTRPSGPGGAYDGTYNQDWEYVDGSGSLDQCNGGTLGGEFVYFATDAYPFFPRCLWGTASSDFMHRGGPPAANVNARAVGPHHQRRTEAGHRGPQFQQRSLATGGLGISSGPRPPSFQQPFAGRRGFGPPTEAVAACTGAGQGSGCAFTAPGRRMQISGVCAQTPEGATACVPRGGQPRL